MYTDVILTALTISTGLLTIATFIRNRDKDTKKDGMNDATLHSDIQYIKSLMIDVRAEIKNATNSIEAHSREISRLAESVKSAHKRIDGIEQRLTHEEYKRE